MGGSGLGGGRRAVRDGTACLRCLFGWRPIAKYKFVDSGGDEEKVALTRSHSSPGLPSR